ncbi:hypothetical protein A3I45_03015 [Candidatus Uhrbacteria bacterium RIFCSPLOWO2_02_FULL_53_10]|uniref:Uncharacterized protein n=1 Tax=Candidatus Uhrbacteria bacterium RIFCSPLOWO2_02_FULL_53_10 TaxID=1802411 RepID=A0A1F7VI96_9BACT|nr:MAG: hypothetical protein A3I45_03015 [Candidatus Uhrbacteria bacterium RIFCSPLOWO2_02_FULL_53_10]
MISLKEILRGVLPFANLDERPIVLTILVCVCVLAVLVGIVADSTALIAMGAIFSQLLLVGACLIVRDRE